MFSLLAPVLRFFRGTPAALAANPAAMLMEDADARAGLDPHHAHELREAASAWLRVVR